MDLDLKNLLANPDLSRKEKVLILLAADPEGAKSVSALRDLAFRNGLRSVKDWNLSQALADLKVMAVRLPTGWALTDAGKSALAALGIARSSPTKTVQPTLHKYATSIGNEKVRAFVEETIAALEFKLLRAAVVLSWVGAVSVLYEFVIQHHLVAFNAEACGRFPKWKGATCADDLTRMKEYDFLQVISVISVIGKNTKDELEHCLKLRNTCGHPNSHKIGEHTVASHVETLVLNVYSKYAI